MRLKEVKKYSFWIILSVVFIFQLNIIGQDLGSSSGIFKSSNKKAKSTETPAKNSTPKKETVKSSPVKKQTAKSSAKSENSNKKVVKITPSSAKSLNNASKSTRKDDGSESLGIESNVIINVGQRNTYNPDTLFEQEIEKGNIARDERNYTKAESIYRQALTIKPRDSRAIYGLGNLFSDQQRWEEAEKAYRQAIQLEPNSPEAHIALSFVLTQPIAVDKLSERYVEAEKLARRAIQLDPNNAVAYDQLGVALELSGVIKKETQDAYRKAIQLEPEFALAYAHLGRLLRRNGLANESSVAYRDAVRLATDVPTKILVAEVMQSQQRYLESEQLLRSALREDPKNPTALFLLGRALTTRGSFDEAEKVLKTSVEVSPSSFVSYTLLGSLYSRQNKFEEAEKILMKAVQVISANEKRRLSQEFEFVGDGFMRVGKGKDAVRLYRQALSLDGDKVLLNSKLNKVQKS